MTTAPQRLLGNAPAPAVTGARGLDRRGSQHVRAGGKVITTDWVLAVK